MAVRCHRPTILRRIFLTKPRFSLKNPSVVQRGEESLFVPFILPRPYNMGSYHCDTLGEDGYHAGVE